LTDIEQVLASGLQQDPTMRTENAEKRGQTYELVEKLQFRLSTMESSLTTLAKDFNTSRGGSFNESIIGGSPQNSVAQTVEILNHQFEMLAELDDRRRMLEDLMHKVVPALRR